jgi:hypothetical protein
VLIPEFVKTLAYENLYESLAELHGVETLVTADKNPWVYSDLMTARRRPMKAVVLFKNPFEFTKSMLREWAGYEPIGAIIRILDAYVRIYETCDFVLKGGNIPAMFLEYRDLATNPEASFQSICSFCELSFNPECLRYWDTPHHRVGGNYARATNEHGIRLDQSWKTTLTNEMRKAVVAHSKAWAVYAGLCAKTEDQ